MLLKHAYPSGFCPTRPSEKFPAPTENRRPHVPSIPPVPYNGDQHEMPVPFNGHHEIPVPFIGGRRHGDVLYETEGFGVPPWGAADKRRVVRITRVLVGADAVSDPAGSELVQFGPVFPCGQPEKNPPTTKLLPWARGPSRPLTPVCTVMSACAALGEGELFADRKKQEEPWSCGTGSAAGVRLRDRVLNVHGQDGRKIVIGGRPATADRTTDRTLTLTLTQSSGGGVGAGDGAGAGPLPRPTRSAHGQSSSLCTTFRKTCDPDGSVRRTEDIDGSIRRTEDIDGSVHRTEGIDGSVRRTEGVDGYVRRTEGTDGSVHRTEGIDDGAGGACVDNTEKGNEIAARDDNYENGDDDRVFCVKEDAAAGLLSVPPEEDRAKQPTAHQETKTEKGQRQRAGISPRLSIQIDSVKMPGSHKISEDGTSIDGAGGRGEEQHNNPLLDDDRCARVGQALAVSGGDSSVWNDESACSMLSVTTLEKASCNSSLSDESMEQLASKRSFSSHETERYGGNLSKDATEILRSHLGSASKISDDNVDIMVDSIVDTSVPDGGELIMQEEDAALMSPVPPPTPSAQASDRVTPTHLFH